MIHEARAAFSGFDNIAAQKYGPPDVGCALVWGDEYLVLSRLRSV